MAGLVVLAAGVGVAWLLVEVLKRQGRRKLAEARRSLDELGRKRVGL